MNLVQLQKKLKLIHDAGYIAAARRGPTGVGHTIEKAFGLAESNIAIPDLGGRVELKGTRRHASSLITLFTFNRGVWSLPQKEVMEKYGYTDDSGRLALYSTVKAGSINSQGLTLAIDKVNNKVNLIHEPTHTHIAIWSMFTIVGKFITKLERLLLVIADSRYNNNGNEEFHYNQAYLSLDPRPENFIEAFNNGIVAIDIRMHLRINKTVRNHGTGFRIREIDLPLLYSNRKNLL